MNELSPPSSGPSRSEHASRGGAYFEDGARRARAFGNRGPVRLGPDGKLHPDILAAYWKHGFYVFEGAVGAGEIAELRDGVGDMIERAPVRPGAEVDSRGRPALGRDYARDPYTLIQPLSDPWGGTGKLNGRHPTQMTQPAPDAGAPDHVVFIVYGMCQAVPAALRLYGNPRLLTIAEAINGPDFVPFNDAIFVKQPGVGGSVAWHQDGVTHWDSPDWDEGSHGFNFQVQLYPTTPANCLWIVPGTHRLGRIDIAGRVAANGGDEKLPDAIPLLCEPGDATAVNRQMLHGSFANSSPDPRISVTFGFHRRRSVIGQRGALSMAATEVYDEKRVFERSAVIQVAIDARSRRFPEEAPYRYAPFAGLEDGFRFGPETFERVIRDYNTKDLAI